jgi:hypothetical protein
MGDEDRGSESPRGPQAAVTVERSAAAAREPGGEVTSPSVRSRIRVRRPARATPAAEPVRAAGPRFVASAGAVAEDEVTEWLGPADQSPPAAILPSGAGPPPASGPRPQPVGQPGSAVAAPVGGPGIGLIVLVVIAALVVGSLAVVTVRRLAGPSASAASAARARQEAAARDEAAAWVDQQVSHGVTVSCDQVMCAVLVAHGFPAHHLLMLGPLSPDPVTSGVVVETAAVRGLFGTSLAMAWAPAVLAAFGSGPAAITIRVMAPNGAAAYQTALAADLAARKTAGAALLRAQRITLLGPAAGQLAAGLVDVRLVLALTALARHQPISVVDFGNTGPGVSAGIPLRYADLAEADPAAAYAQSVRAHLSTVNAIIRPARVVSLVLSDGQAILRVEYTAPSPLGESASS